MSRMAEEIGRVLGGRYRLIAPIGSGASAQVFLADDTRLRRRVAVKLLHAGLSDDEAFLRRFRAEARAAAALSHPNIVTVYDWGDDDLPYLVTEYLGGGSLRGILDAGRRLTPAQALLIGLQAARGLEYAHRRGFVHRDVKPANLLFGDEGRLRIADFGLARALAEAAWTEPSGVVVGTARYASPEQARGEQVDGRADVYSLGLVLIEAVTGHVPFAADTTIATLMARVATPVTVPSELGPLAGVLARAGRPDVDERPDVADFAVGLMAAASELDRPAPLPLAGATPVDVDPAVADRDRTLLPGAGAPVPTRAPAGGAPAGGAGAAHGTGHGTGIGTPGRRARRRAERADRGQARRERRSERRAAIEAGTVRRRRWPRVLVAVVVAAAVLGGAALAWDRLRVPSHEVPALAGVTEDNARALVADFDWDLEVAEGRQDGSRPGEIIDQDPAPGERLEEGGTLEVTVSLGNTPTEVPVGLAGVALADAQAAVEAAELTLGEPVRRFDETVPLDHVIEVDPSTPAELPKGDPVVLVVSDGPEPRAIPPVAGASFEEAAAALAGVQLLAEQAQGFSETVPAGQVIGTEPGAGAQAPRDSTVTVVVSRGPELIAVPSVADLAVAEATARLEQAGFEVTGVVGSPTGSVIATDPPAGEPHRRGTEVVILSRR